jgi:hypothetical protein
VRYVGVNSTRTVVTDGRLRHVKTGLSFEEHVAIGRRLKTTLEELQTLLGTTARGYPTTDPAYRYARQTLDRLSKLRSALDSAAYREHGQTCAHVYYGRDGEGGALPHNCATRRDAPR